MIKALLLAAGSGTRLRPLTDTMPKCLVPVAGRPLLDYWLDALGDAAIMNARINTHAHAEQVRTYIEKRNSQGCLRIEESYEPNLLGSAGTMTANSDLADNAEAVIIIYADNLSEVDLSAMLEYHRSHDDPVTMLLFHAKNPKECGIAELNAAGRVTAFVEKPQTPKSDLANAGVYIVDAEAYREMAAAGGFDIGFDLLPRFVGRIRGWPIKGVHIDIGTPEKYEQSQKLALPLQQRRAIRSDGSRRAVFLDRDGTLIEQVHYLGDPAKVRLLPGAATALRRLRSEGYLCIMVTNQAAIGKRLITVEDYHAVNTEMCRQLAEAGAVLDAIYFCPVPGASGGRTAVSHPDRKPGPGMLQTAACDHNLLLHDCWMIGDTASDIMAGKNAGCAGSILVDSGLGLSEAESSLLGDVPKVACLDEAVTHLLSRSVPGSAVTDNGEKNI